MAGRPRRDHRLGRAARALGVGPVRVEPEPERHADRVRPGAQERDGAIDAAAHRDGDAVRSGGARKTGPSAFASASTGSVSPPTAAASSSVSPTSGRVETVGVRVDDPVASTASRTSAKSLPRAESPSSSITRFRLATGPGRARLRYVRHVGRSSRGATVRGLDPVRGSRIPVTNNTAEGAGVRPRRTRRLARHPPGLSRFTAGVSHGRVRGGTAGRERASARTAT